MIRSIFASSMLCGLVAIAACSKSGTNDDASPSSSSGAAASLARPSFTALGAGACDKYLTTDVVKKILGTDVDERKKLSGQSCTVHNTKTDGSLTITLKYLTPQAFHSFRDFLSDPAPLAGVGDSALTSIAPTLTAIKGNMGCDFDASRGSSPAALSGAERAKALGAVCNKIFADGH